jgi:DNA-directed RNA polymerase subunit delta
MIELAYEIMASKKQPLAFKEMVEEIGRLLDLTEEELRARMSQFYTDLNIDGRFLTIGENKWGLRSWYPYDQIEEEIVQPVKAKKKGKKKVADEDEDFDLEDFDEVEDEEYDDLDDIDSLEEDDDDLLDDDDDDDDDDEDEDEDFDDELLDDDLDLDEDSDDEEEDEDFDGEDGDEEDL